MAIISVRALADGRSAERNDEFHREYVRSWQVLTDNPLTDELTVRLAPGIPQPYDFYISTGGTFDRYALAKEITARCPDADDPWRWVVTVTYSTRTKDPGRQSQDDPTQALPQIKWGKTTVMRPIVREVLYFDDSNALQPRKSIVNSAGTPYDPVPEQPQYMLTLTVVRNEATFDAATAVTYLGAINNDPFLGVKPRQAMCTDYSGTLTFGKNLSYYAVNYEFVFNTSPDWLTRILDYGPYTIDPKYTIPTARNGQSLPGPIRLDGVGRPLGDGKDPVYNVFHTLEEIAFAPLKIGTR